MTTATISVVIPACNSSAFLTRCLLALRESTETPLEIIVVDDGSTDDTGGVATSFGVRICTTETRRGPAFARNLGATAAKGSHLFFLDSDVCVLPDTMSRIAASFASDPGLDALIGSYDSSPASPDFISQYRNLMHAYVHGVGAREASTFWSGCGAIRREVFLEHSGFSEHYGRPAIEDIELGYRLTQAGCKVNLDPAIQVTHLKRWTFWGLLKTDIFDRGIPWTELILRDRRMPNDLNLQLSQRVSVALVMLLVGLAAGVAVQSGLYLLIPPFAVIIVMLAGWWGEVSAYSSPKTTYASMICLFAAVIGVAYVHRMYALIVPLAISPAILLLRHRYCQHDGLRRTMRLAGIAYICIVVVTAARYTWAPHHLVTLSIVLLAITALLNNQFYVFLAGKRGLVFMLAAIPFHFLYHFYSGLSFLIGTALHFSFWRAQPGTPRRTIPGLTKLDLRIPTGPQEKDSCPDACP